MALVVEIKMVPRSGVYRWQFDRAGRLKCHLTLPPEKGLANQELVKKRCALDNICPIFNGVALRWMVR
jgi:uncharacterized protein YggU (UPF0235/DUF167 family)